MTTISTTLSSTQRQHLRPIDPRRDLDAVADLIELCFADSMDADGRRYLSNIRQSARNINPFFWAGAAFSRAATATDGYVWVQDRQIVGNLSLIPFLSQGKRINLIANVAVHPDFCRQGIARALTSAGLARSRRQKAHATWLHVRENNPGAIALYTSMGFESRARRTTWLAEPGNLAGEGLPGVRATPHKIRHWKFQRNWLQLNYPPALRWHWSFQTSVFHPGIWGLVARFFAEIDVKQWALERHKQLLGVLTRQASHSYADKLWLAAPPNNEDFVLQALLPMLQREARGQRPLTLDYPAGRAHETLLAAGFVPRQTLIWMELKT